MKKKYSYKISNKITGPKLWLRAKKTIAGGNMLLTKNPDRYLSEYWPTYFSKTKGCKIWDLDSNTFLDFSYMGVGTNSLGYSRHEVDEEVINHIKLGNMSSLNAPEEVLLSEQLLKLNPWADKVRYTRSGGEANAVAVRLARTYQKKDKIMICGYHGWHDWYIAANIDSKNNLDESLIKGLNPGGVPKELMRTTIPFKYNDIDTFKKIIKNNKGQIAAVKMEVVRNIEPSDDFLKKIREITIKEKIILIFDECTSGFREKFGGIYSKYNVTPDMIIYGKALGNGYAINAILGKGDIMNSINQTFISSTFWTERIGYVAALATLKTMKKEKSWKKITDIGKNIRNFWSTIFSKYELDVNIQGIPALSNFFFKHKDNKKYIQYICKEMLEKGFISNNVFYSSTAHDNKSVEKYTKAFNNTIFDLKEAIDSKRLDKYLKKFSKQKEFIGRLN